MLLLPLWTKNLVVQGVERSYACKIPDYFSSDTYWYGFYNKKTNAYEWKTEPDFLENTLLAVFNKCE